MKQENHQLNLFLDISPTPAVRAETLVMSQYYRYGIKQQSMQHFGGMLQLSDARGKSLS
jgi:hypothetical protein